MVVEKDKFTEFYQSYDWRKVRYEVLKLSDGKCQLCGRSKHDGIVLNVDHIIALRRNWSLRLNKRNLQVLCHECNHGKGNQDATDWRAAKLIERAANKAERKRKKKLRRMLKQKAKKKKERGAPGTFGPASSVRHVSVEEYENGRSP